MEQPLDRNQFFSHSSSRDYFLSWNLAIVIDRILYHYSQAYLYEMTYLKYYYIEAQMLDWALL